jgi:hypothetical protein
MTQPPDVTGLLVAWSNGDGDANDRVTEAVYAELRALARGCLRRECPDHSLGAVGARARDNRPPGVAPITVKRDWALALACLFRERRGEA